ncbi:toll/interleukin-1 receptor domain-containing protein [Aegicerativicinus sediminis]|uniref:toll/interleukin-1 receptor domain-containing protein n=1 Tax=Aegicerativicinus sediminis TaxID=2893202 RepID=UPI001E2A929B|nr:toll/interleukin-1 receptor domain-containing protein [Aegicerativicinus sediminis]
MKNVFISYSHDNQHEQETLKKHLAVLKRKGLISDWSDKEIIVGDSWDDLIKTKLDEADIVLFLVSAEFLASDYINNVEIEKTIASYGDKNIKVVPVILNHCMWEETVLKNFQAAPIEEGRLKPISEWPDQNKAYYTVSLELLKSINKELTNDENLTKVFKYKTEISKWDEEPASQGSKKLDVSIDTIFKYGLLGLMLVAFAFCVKGLFTSDYFLAAFCFVGIFLIIGLHYAIRIFEIKNLKLEIQ